jgi:hypothetical protein
MADASPDRLPHHARLALAERVGKLERWMKMELELFAATPEPVRNPLLHAVRVQWFRDEIDKARAKCPHPPVARFRPGTIFPDQEPPPVRCADCGKELTT